MKVYKLVEEVGGGFQDKADIVEFDSGKVVVCWLGEVSSIVIHENLNNFKKISVNSEHPANSESAFVAHNRNNMEKEKISVHQANSDSNSRRPRHSRGREPQHGPGCAVCDLVRSLRVKNDKVRIYSADGF